MIVSRILIQKPNNNRWCPTLFKSQHIVADLVQQVSDGQLPLIQPEVWSEATTASVVADAAAAIR